MESFRINISFGITRKELEKRSLERCRAAEFDETGSLPLCPPPLGGYKYKRVTAASKGREPV